MAIVTAFAVAVAGIIAQPITKTYADDEGTELLQNTTFADDTYWVIHGDSGVNYRGDGSAVVSLGNIAGGNAYDKEIYQNGLTLVEGKYYEAKLTVTSTVSRKIAFKFQRFENGWDMYHTKEFSVEANVPYTFETAFVAHDIPDAMTYLFGLNLGRIDADINQTSQVTISNVSFKEFDEAPEGFLDLRDLGQNYSIVRTSAVNVVNIQGTTNPDKQAIYIIADSDVQSVSVNGNIVTLGGSYDSYAKIQGASAFIYLDGLTLRNNTAVFNCLSGQKTISIINYNVSDLTPEQSESASVYESQSASQWESESQSVYESQSVHESQSNYESQSVFESQSAYEQESRDAYNDALPWVDVLNGTGYKYKILEEKDDIVSVKPEIHGDNIIYAAFGMSAPFDSVKLDGNTIEPRAGADVEIPVSSVNDGAEHTLVVVDYYKSQSVSIKFKYESEVTITTPQEVVGLVANSNAPGAITFSWGNADSAHLAAGQTYNVYVNGVKHDSNVACGERTITGLTEGSTVTLKVTGVIGGNESTGATVEIVVMSTPVEVGTMVSNDLGVVGFQIKTNFESEAESEAAFRTICKCPSDTITVNEVAYNVVNYGIIYTIDDNATGYKKNNAQTKNDTFLDFENPVDGQQYRYQGIGANASRTKGYISTAKALVPSLNNRNDGNDYYVTTMSQMNSVITHSFHVRAFAIVSKNENQYIVYSDKVAVVSIPEIADYIYTENLSPNIQGHQYLFNLLSNTLFPGLIPTTNPYYRTTTIEYGWDGNLHEEPTTYNFEIIIP